MARLAKCPHFNIRTTFFSPSGVYIPLMTCSISVVIRRLVWKEHGFLREKWAKSCLERVCRGGEETWGAVQRTEEALIKGAAMGKRREIEATASGRQGGM